ncbi:MAG: DoxX protein [Alistipes sp.]|nr:DoxX protein [Alistipes sp.]
MGASLRNRRWYRILSHVCRVCFAVTFIFSGFFKAIDPWGTAININNYLVTYGLEELKPLVMIFSIWLCGAELMMGCMLLFKVRIRLISIFALCSMTFFTILTFLSATFIPVEDCGCFGEVLKLTPLQTFIKNLVLLPMVICFWWRYRPDRIFSFSKLEMALTVFFFTMAMSVGTYSYLNLPPIDLLPYKKGVNIAEKMARARERQATDEVVLVYRNTRNGKLREFSLKDKAWRNDKRWEWVETRVEESADGVEPMILEFHVSDGGRDVTDSLLAIRGNLYLLCVQNFDDVTPSCEQRISGLARQAESEGSAVVCLTPEYLASPAYHTFSDGTLVRCYNMDSKTMRTMLRASEGVVLLRDGVIIRKHNLRFSDF